MMRRAGRLIGSWMMYFMGKRCEYVLDGRDADTVSTAQPFGAKNEACGQAKQRDAAWRHAVDPGALRQSRPMTCWDVRRIDFRSGEESPQGSRRLVRIASQIRTE
jgi:hypothetical protein